MDLLDFFPFRDEMAKVYHGLTDNATHTSDNPVFSELKVRRYERPMKMISSLILEKIDWWVGWQLKSQKTAVGDILTIRANVISFALLGMTIDITFGLVEETDPDGLRITTVNAKAHTRIESKGDLGESRRMLRMMLTAIDDRFGKYALTEEEYQSRSVDPDGSTRAFQQIFNDTVLEHLTAKSKAKPIEYKKNEIYEIPLHIGPTAGSKPGASVPSTDSTADELAGNMADELADALMDAFADNMANEMNGHSEEASEAPTRNDQNSSEQKITVITLKNNS